jgi:two-component system, LytTR family, sensor kinase
MKKFDRKVWIFITAAAFVIPAFYLLKTTLTGVELVYNFLPFVIIFSFVVTLSITYVNMVLLGRYFDKILPWQNIPKKINIRLALETLITTITAAMIISLIAFVLDRFYPEMMQGKRAVMYFDNITVAIVVNMIALGIIEGNSIFLMLKESMLNTERLKRENIESQFEVLKNQVNPHFLFNSLNVLSSLVSQSPEKAREFIGEFSRIYRYIFDVGNEAVIEVGRELDFINAFISLNQKRHGENLRCSVNVSLEALNRFIPVLSMQILVENAIKHNEISDQHPLKIEIYDEDDLLIVKNNFQPRIEKQESLGIGLTNLMERYHYLTDQKPVFIKKDNEYIASLPLLQIT